MTYAAVRARPDGASTVARLAQTAAEYEYDGIVVRNHGDEPASYDPAAIRDATGIDVVAGVEVRADEPSSASGYVGNYRQDRAVVAVHGGDPAINRFAVEQPAVDVLAHPMRGDGDLNHVLAKAAAENGVRLELDLGPVLRDAGGQRVRAIAALRKQWELIEQYDVPYVVSDGASSHLELRAPRELVAVCEQLDVDPEAASAGLEEWRDLAERNRDRHGERFVEPGVWRGPGEDFE
jgi:ribonuclease P/MRP protein subunit RPP1